MVYVPDRLASERAHSNKQSAALACLLLEMCANGGKLGAVGAHQRQVAHLATAAEIEHHKSDNADLLVALAA